MHDLPVAIPPAGHRHCLTRSRINVNLARTPFYVDVELSRSEVFAIRLRTIANFTARFPIGMPMRITTRLERIVLGVQCVIVAVLVAATAGLLLL